jgi:hypothetical protein
MMYRAINKCKKECLTRTNVSKYEDGYLLEEPQYFEQVDNNCPNIRFIKCDWGYCLVY